MKPHIFKFILLVLFVAEFSFAKIVRIPYEGVRPTGMGNAFISLADDANAVWYNPAGLARMRSVHVNVFDFVLGVDSLDTFNRISNAVFKGQYSNLLRKDRQYGRFSAMPMLITPYFAFGLFDHINSFTEIGNFRLDEIDIYSANDLGAIVGFGIPMGRYIAVGVSVRAIQRTGVDGTFSPTQLLSSLGVQQTDFESAIYDHLQKMAGVGFGVGANVGAILTAPLDKDFPTWRVAATIEDFGNTSFTKVGTKSPPKSIPSSYNLGTSLTYQLSKKSVLNLALDTRHLLNSDVTFVNKISAGIEFRHRNYALRAGFYQGYPTGGFSLKLLPHTHIHFSTYARELGGGFQERGQRWYLLQTTIGFNPL